MATGCAVATAPSPAATGIRSGNRINAGDFDYDSDARAKLILVLPGNSIARNESSRVQFSQQFIGAPQMWNHNAAAHHERDVERLFLFDPRHA
jgi:hypothetical protein